MFFLKVLHLIRVASFFSNYCSMIDTRLTIILKHKRLHGNTNRISFLERGEKILRGWCLPVFVDAGGPKMADAQTPFCASLLRFRGAVSQPRVQSEAAGRSHICRHLCVYQRLRSGSQSTQGLPAGMGSVFWQKRKRIPGTEANGSFPSSPSSSDYMQGSVSCLLDSLDICAHTFKTLPTTHCLPLIPCCWDYLKKKSKKKKKRKLE